MFGIRRKKRILNRIKDGKAKVATFEKKRYSAGSIDLTSYYRESQHKEEYLIKELEKLL